MSDKYILNADHSVTPCDDLLAWGTAFETTDRRVAHSDRAARSRRRPAESEGRLMLRPFPLASKNERDRERRKAAALASTAPIYSLADPRFVYTTAAATNIRATLDRARQALEAAKQ